MAIQIASAPSAASPPGPASPASVPAGSGSVIVAGAPEERIESDTVIGGTWHIDKQITVVANVTLTILPGTTVTADPGCGLTIRGHLQAIDDAGGISFDVQGQPGDTWTGVRFDGGTGALRGVAIRHADRGVACTGTGAVTLTCIAFFENTVGLHCYGGSITVDGCDFVGNTVYGVKEDNGCSPLVLDSSFQNNGISYYDDKLTEITIDELNAMPGNGGNSF